MPNFADWQRVTALPTAGVDYLGKTRVLVTVGIPDVPYLCVLTATSTYAWRPVVAAMLAQGAWSASMPYIVNEIVTDAGSTYMCLLAHTNHEPPNATYWSVIASSGGAPSGPAGGVLGGLYPDPAFAVDMATQAELDTVAANGPSAGEKAALAGSSGTPGSGNKYVTDADARNSNTRTPSSTLAHKATHQDGGTDEITVLGLSGLLADGQTPLAHAASHAFGSTDVVTLTEGQITNLTTDLAARALVTDPRFARIGMDGNDGEEGPMGPPGVAGATGASGSQGIQGIQGNPGVAGASGSMGPMGLSGDDGTDGWQGPPGVNGATGAAGSNGAPGSNGTNGAAGAMGVPGQDGDDADASWTPPPTNSVSGFRGLLADQQTPTLTGTMAAMLLGATDNTSLSWNVQASSFQATIVANAVTNARLADMATATIKGRTTAGTADPEDLTVAQVNAMLPVFTSLLAGLVPASGGGTTTYLRADGTFATVVASTPDLVLIKRSTTVNQTVTAGYGAIVLGPYTCGQGAIVTAGLDAMMRAQ